MDVNDSIAEEYSDKNRQATKRVLQTYGWKAVSSPIVLDKAIFWQKCCRL